MASFTKPIPAGPFTKGAGDPPGDAAKFAAALTELQQLAVSQDTLNTLISSGQLNGTPGTPGTPGTNGRDGTGVLVLAFSAAVPAGTAANTVIAQYGPEQQAAATSGSATLTLNAHGLVANQPVLVLADFGGFTAGTTYYARDIATNTFALSATVDASGVAGTAKASTAAGSLRFAQ